MGNKDFLSEGCDMGWCADLPGKLCNENLDKKKNQKMVIWLCQKILIKICSKRGGPADPAPHPPKKKIKFFGFFVKIHSLENSKYEL